MASVAKSITVDVPVRTCYNQWTQFENFPEFMEGVKEVRQLDDKHLHWIAEIGGKEKEWTAEITQQEPDRLISWRTESGAKTSGTVRFTPQGSTGCRIDIAMEYEPEGFLENVGDALGFVGGRIQRDLDRFKAYIESLGKETGAWRGEIKGRRVTRRSGEHHEAPRKTEGIQS